MSKICNLCGAENPNEAKFCRKCGKQTFSDSIEEDNFEINEDDLYEQAWIEVENNTQVKRLWAKAFAQNDGDEDKAKAAYLKFRVSDLKKDALDKVDMENQKRRKKTIDIEMDKNKADNQLKAFLSLNAMYTTKKISDFEYRVGYQSSPRDSIIKYTDGTWRIV